MSATGKANGGGFAVRTMLALVLVGVFAFVGLGVLSAYQPETGRGNDGGGHALSKASIGYAGLVELLRLSGTPVVMSRGVLSQDAGDGLLILTPPDGSDGKVIEAISHTGNMLIVLPKWNVVANTPRKGWVRTIDTIKPEASLLDVLPEEMRVDTRLMRRTGTSTVQLSVSEAANQPVGDPARIEQLQTISGPLWIPMLVDQTGAAVIAWHEETGIFVLADPDLLNTQGLKTLAGAERAMEIIASIHEAKAPVIFDLTLHGFARPRSLLRLMFEPPLLGVTLVVLALAALAGLQAAIRFGPAREKGRAVALGKRALADNTAGLVRLAKREHRMASPYALLVKAAVARAIGAPRRLSDSELDGFLDRVGATAGTGGRYTELAERARAARTPSDLMSVARDLHNWKLEMTRGRH